MYHGESLSMLRESPWYHYQEIPLVQTLAQGNLFSVIIQISLNLDTQIILQIYCGLLHKEVYVNALYYMSQYAPWAHSFQLYEARLKASTSASLL